jgi:hypothetical protein
MSNTYLLTNPAWSGWTKVGVTVHPKKRLVNYNTATPFNDCEFKTIIPFEHSSILEDCVLIHFNGASEPKEWVNKPHDEILPVFMDYKQKIEKNPEKWRKWVESKKEEVEGDTYKYVKYGKESAGSKWKFKFTNKEGLKLLIDSKELDVNVDDVDVTKFYTSRELAVILKVYKNNGDPYQALIGGWGKNRRAKYYHQINLPDGMFNKYGIHRVEI